MFRSTLFYSALLCFILMRFDLHICIHISNCDSPRLSRSAGLLTFCNVFLALMEDLVKLGDLFLYERLPGSLAFAERPALFQQVPSGNGVRSESSATFERALFR